MHANRPRGGGGGEKREGGGGKKKNNKKKNKEKGRGRERGAEQRRRPGGCAGRGAGSRAAAEKRPPLHFGEAFIGRGGAGGAGPRGPSAPRIGCAGSPCDRGGGTAPIPAPPLANYYGASLRGGRRRGCLSGARTSLPAYTGAWGGLFIYLRRSHRTPGSLLEQSLRVRGAALRGALRKPAGCRAAGRGGNRRRSHRVAPRPGGLRRGLLRGDSCSAATHSPRRRFPARRSAGRRGAPSPQPPCSGALCGGEERGWCVCSRAALSASRAQMNPPPRTSAFQPVTFFLVPTPLSGAGTAAGPAASAPACESARRGRGRGGWRCAGRRMSSSCSQDPKSFGLSWLEPAGICPRHAPCTAGAGTGRGDAGRGSGVPPTSPSCRRPRAAELRQPRSPARCDSR